MNARKLTWYARVAHHQGLVTPRLPDSITLTWRQLVAAIGGNARIRRWLRKGHGRRRPGRQLWEVRAHIGLWPDELAHIAASVYRRIRRRPKALRLNRVRVPFLSYLQTLNE